MHVITSDAERERAHLTDENARLRSECDASSRLLQQANDELQEVRTRKQGSYSTLTAMVYVSFHSPPEHTHVYMHDCTHQ